MPASAGVFILSFGALTYEFMDMVLNHNFNNEFVAPTFAVWLSAGIVSIALYAHLSENEPL